MPARCPAPPGTSRMCSVATCALTASYKRPAAAGLAGLLLLPAAPLYTSTLASCTAAAAAACTPRCLSTAGSLPRAGGATRCPRAAHGRRTHQLDADLLPRQQVGACKAPPARALSTGAQGTPHPRPALATAARAAPAATSSAPPPGPGPSPTHRCRYPQSSPSRFSCRGPREPLARQRQRLDAGALQRMQRGALRKRRDGSQAPPHLPRRYFPLQAGQTAGVSGRGRGGGARPSDQEAQGCRTGLGRALDLRHPDVHPPQTVLGPGGPPQRAVAAPKAAAAFSGAHRAECGCADPGSLGSRVQAGEGAGGHQFCLAMRTGNRPANKCHRCPAPPWSLPLALQLLQPPLPRR